MTADPRPAGCCGVCPPIVGGGYDCTCLDNPPCIPVRVTEASVRRCVMYVINLAFRGEGTDQIGTALTVEISEKFDRWLAEHDAALIEELADGLDRMGDVADAADHHVSWEWDAADHLREKAHQKRKEQER